MDFNEKTIFNNLYNEIFVFFNMFAYANFDCLDTSER